MSLQVWLPLNGHIKNYGLSNITTSLINNPAIVTSNRGECYSFNPSGVYNQAIELNIPNIAQWIKNEISISFWVYHQETAGRSILFGNHNIGPYTFNIEKAVTSNRLRVYMHGQPDFSITECVMDENTWTHITVVKTATNLKIYKNGILVKERQHASSDYWDKAEGEVYRIGRDGRADATALNGMMSDFRIYDHALSVKEIKDISKGLILNFPFESPYMTKTVNLLGGLTLNGHGSTFVKLDETYLGEPVYRNTVTSPSTGNNAGFSYTSGIIPSSWESATITLSFYKRLNAVYGKNLGGYLRFVDSAGTTLQTASWSYNKANWANDSTSLGKWEKITATVTINATTLASVAKISHFYVYTDQATGGVCDFSHIQIEFGNTATAYSNGARTGVIEDISGYKHHGEIIGNAFLSTDTDCGDYSLYLNKEKTVRDKVYVRAPIKMTNIKNFTIAANVKVDTWGHQTSGIWCLDSSSGASNYTSSPCHHRDSHFDLSAQGNTSSSVGATYKRLSCTSSDVPPGVWTHVAVTYNGITASLYINGEFKRSVAFDAETILSDCNYIILGYSNAGGANRCMKALWSDFRIYTTSLSESDIFTLANKKAAIDTNSNYHCFKLNEKYDIEHNLFKTGVLNTGAKYDFINLYPQKQYSTSNITVTYNYETDIFKDYGLTKCTKFAAKVTSTDAFKAYSYMMPITKYKASTYYTFSCYAYVSPDCNANFDFRVGSSTSWSKNYQGTSNISDSRKGEVIKVWGTVKTSSTGIMRILLYPNYNVANVFTTGYILVAGFTVCEGSTPMHPIEEKVSENLIASLTPGKNMAAVSGKPYNLTADFSAAADTYSWINTKKPLEWDKMYRLTFSVSGLEDDSEWGWGLWNKAAYSFTIDRTGFTSYTFIPRKSSLLGSDLSLSKFLFDDQQRVNPTGTVTFSNFSLVECIASQSHGFFETEKAAIHPLYTEMHNVYEFI